MTDLEQDLREHLAARASDANVGRDDWGDLNRRIGKRRRDQRSLLVGACAALLVALPVAGLAIVNASDGSGTSLRSVQPGSAASVIRPSATTTTTRSCPTAKESSPSTPTTLSPSQVGQPASTTRPTGGEASTGCSPSPMPRAGVQPADRAHARAAVEAAFTAAYEGGLALTPASRAVIEDGAALAPLADQVRAGPYPALLAHSSVKVRDVVFTSPSRAAVRFDSYVEGGVPGRAGTIGAAVLVDGHWLVSHDTACVDLRLVGALCPGFAPLAAGG
jgi:hypothetical protein